MTKVQKYVLFFAFALFASSSAQTPTAIKRSEVDLKKAHELQSAAEEGDSVKFYKLAQTFRAEAISSNNHFLLNSIYDKTGVYLYMKGRFKSALTYFDTAISISLKYKMDDVIAANYMNKGAVNYMLINYSAALNDFRSSEIYLKKIGSPKIGGLYGNISLLYQEVGDLDNAKKYIHKSLPFVKLYKEPDSYAKALNNLGLIYKKEKNYRAADSMFRFGYAFCKSKKLSSDLADVLYNLVNILTLENKLTEALSYSEELIAHVKKYKDASWVKLVLLDHARIYQAMGNLSLAKKYLLESEAISFDGEVLDRDEESSFQYKAELYYALKMYEKAASSFSSYFKIHDQNASQEEAMSMQQLSYKYEKHQDSLANAKEKEITELENLRVQEKAEAKLKQQRIIIFVSLFGFILIIGFSISLIRANRNKEKANKEISYQKGLLTEKNKEITDSITYAQRIQQSLLPPLDLLEILLPKHFLVYMPKDIVSGDFFWAKKLNANEVFVAVADCTGHGVPGAMMSALSIQNLNELSTQTRSASELLSLLNINLKNTLNQDQEGFSKDGLDICLCKINTKEKKITYSGANRSLQVFNEKGLKLEIKATKTGIAGHTLDSQIYAEHEVILEDSDMVVMSTDGFADQFGGTENKKITTKRFKDWMSEIVSINDKKTELEQRFKAWKGSKDQIDDVCVLGFKI